jgi:hypothetical protein
MRWFALRRTNENPPRGPIVALNASNWQRYPTAGSGGTVTPGRDGCDGAGLGTTHVATMVIAT